MCNTGIMVTMSTRSGAKKCAIQCVAVYVSVIELNRAIVIRTLLCWTSIKGSLKVENRVLTFLVNLSLTVTNWNLSPCWVQRVCACVKRLRRYLIYAKL